MKITDVEAWLFHRPLAEPFYPSWITGYASTMNSAVIYRLHTDEGIDGICGGVAFADEAKGPVNLMRVYMSGLDVYDDAAEIYSRLRSANRTLGIRAWFLEAGFWDIRGKAENKSVAELLGAKRNKIPAYASTGQVRDPDDAAKHALGVLERGFKGIKIRTRHATVEEDLAMVRAVREAIGDDIVLMCDANQAWRVDVFGKGPVWDLERATATARGMEEFGVAWLEEPLDMYDFDGYAELRKRTSTPIAAGELHGEPSLVELQMNAGAVDIVQPDLVFTGGVTGVWDLVQKSHARGMKYAPHCWTNGLGLAANLQVATAAPNCDWLEFPYDPPGWTPEGRDGMLSTPIEVDSEGFVAARGPGLGVELDEDALKTYGMPI